MLSTTLGCLSVLVPKQESCFVCINELEDVNYNLFPKRDMYVGIMNDYEVMVFLL